MKAYIDRVRDYMTDDLCGPVAWYEIFVALWVCLWNADIYRS